MPSSSMEAQRVVVIQDASREVSSSALRWALQGLSLKLGDTLTFLSIVHQVKNPCKSPYAATWKLLGFKHKVDSNSIFGADKKIIGREVARKKEEYEKHTELIQIFELYEMHKVEFKIQVAVGPSPKVVALKAAENLRATWVILDRQMKKDRRYFLQKLSCGISRMKRNNRVEQLRGQKAKKANTPPKQEQRHSSLVTYDDMMPGTPDDLFSIDFRPSVSEMEQESQVSQIQEIVHLSSIEEAREHSICAFCKNRRPSSGSLMDFTYEELHAATDGFSSKNSLYDGGFGSAFRGHLKSKNLKIVVKQHKNAIPRAEMSFISEITLLKTARHKNVLMLLGSCTEGSLKLLVHEYACNGSLNQHLSKHCPLPLTWMERMKVALGAARGLNYLHENNIVHKNVRTSSIVLTHDFEPLLGDFGFPSEDKVLETLGYLAPEYPGNWQLSTATDVYAFGVVLLELISGQMVRDKMPGGKSLVHWARPLLKERRLLEMVDPRIAKSHDAEQLYWMGRVILNCLHRIPNKRLTMDMVVSALECIADRRSSNLMEDISAVNSYLARSISDIDGLQSYEKSYQEDMLISREIIVKEQQQQVMGRSFSLTSSSSSFSSGTATTNSTRTSTSFSRSSTSSREKSDQMHTRLSRNKKSVYYAEMHN